MADTGGRWADTVGRWAAGNAYGPVLSQTDLYLLNVELQINPILTDSSPSFSLVCDFATGKTFGFNPEQRDRDLPFSAKNEPATLPRVAELMIITNSSPWCTIVKNPQGVTLDDVCSTIFKDYTENFVTDAEFSTLAPRLQEQVRRYASNSQGPGWNGYYTPAQVPSRYRRVDWLREKVFFHMLQRNDNYAVDRLGFSAPNIFEMTLNQY